jgi:hypothetical protein
LWNIGSMLVPTVAVKLVEPPSCAGAKKNQRAA